MSLPDQSAAVPLTVSVKVSQLMPSWQSSSPPIKSRGAFGVAPPGALPIQVSGAVAAGLMVPPAGADADVLLKGSARASNAAAELIANASRHGFRASEKIRMVFRNLEM